MTDNPDTSNPTEVKRYFAANPEVLAVELTNENTVPRRPR